MTNDSQKINKDKFKTKAGRLTPYAFACGYLETCETTSGTIELSLDGIYQVKKHDHKTNKRIFWESFEKLTDARKFYDKNKKV